MTMYFTTNKRVVSEVNLLEIHTSSLHRPDVPSLEMIFFDGVPDFFASERVETRLHPREPLNNTIINRRVIFKGDGRRTMEQEERSRV